MFKIIFLSCLCLAIFATTFASVYYESYFRDEAHPGKCTIQNRIIRPGQTIRHPEIECGQFTCDNSIGLATIEMCDPVSALAPPLAQLQCYDHENPPSCLWGEFVDKTQPFPKCCKRSFTCTYKG